MSPSFAAVPSGPYLYGDPDLETGDAVGKGRGPGDPRLVRNIGGACRPDGPALLSFSAFLYKYRITSFPYPAVPRRHSPVQQNNQYKISFIPVFNESFTGFVTPAPVIRAE